MSKIGFLYIAAFFLTMALVSSSYPVDYTIQITVCFGLIALVGIPHGAIDHVIFLEGNEKPSIPKFIGAYVLIMTAYALFWYFLPVVSLFIFLVLSAYHFGQSQFVDTVGKGKKLSTALYSSWGVSLLSALIVYNHKEVITLSSDSPDMQPLMILFDYQVQLILLVASLLLTLFLLFVYFRKGKMDAQRLANEIYLLALIHLTFYVFPLFIGFTLYFVILHSIKVMGQEYEYLSGERQNLSLVGFIKMLLPLSLISYVGMGLLIYLVYTGFLALSYPLLGFVLISLITLPHAFVMEDFYTRLFKV